MQIWDTLTAFWARLDTIVLPAWAVLAVALPVLVVLLYVGHRQQNPAEGPSRVWLAQQLELLAQAGVHLRPGLGLDDLLAQLPASAYRRQPELILAAMGGAYEEDGVWHAYSDQVTHFDYECIDDPECYETAVFTPLTALLPPEVPRSITIAPGPHLDWQIGETRRSIAPRQDDDWADEAVIDQLLADIRAALPAPFVLSRIEDGQSISLCVLDANALAGLRKTLAPELVLV